MSQPQLSLPLGFASRDTGFLVGECHHRALLLLQSWQSWPGHIGYLFGPASCGKSRLARAWAENAGASVVAARDLVSGPLTGNLVVDGVENLENEEALFHLLNDASAPGAFVLMTSRLAPGGLELDLADLRTRLNAAALAEIGPPDQTFLEGLLVRLAEQRQLPVDQALAAYCAARMERTHAAAVNLISALDRQSLAVGKPPSIKLAAQLLDGSDP